MPYNYFHTFVIDNNTTLSNLVILTNILEKVYKSLVQPYLEYWTPLWDTCGKFLNDKLQRFQFRAARVLTGASYDIHATDIIETLSSDTLDTRRLRAK